MPDEEHDADYWRALAMKAIAAAAELTDPQAKAIMIDIAQRYEKLAKMASARNEHSKK
jgi:hypothetical protein